MKDKGERKASWFSCPFIKLFFQLNLGISVATTLNETTANVVNLVNVANLNDKGLLICVTHFLDTLFSLA